MANPYKVIGSGDRKVIALHGWFGDRNAYAAMWPYLDGGAFSYAFMDYRGYGEAKELKGSYTIEEIAADALGVADELGWERFSLIGHSMGGKAIQRVLLDAPGRVEKLIGITPVPASAVPMDEAGWALFSGAADEPGNRRAIIDFTTGNRLTGVWLDAMVRTSLAVSTRDAFAAYLDAWVKTDLQAAIAGNPVPVKVIAGEHDAALGPDTMRATWMQWYPNAELDVFANAGHYPMDETPVALATSIEQFLTA